MSAAEEWERRRAADDLARLLRGQRNPGTAPDPDVAAAEFFTILRSRGWRWIEDLAPHARHPVEPGRLGEDAKAAALAACRADAEQFRARDRGGGPCPTPGPDQYHPSQPPGES